MLNRDLADEHAAIIRYLIHSYLEGEDSPLGAGLLSRAREEMWHMHWLGMIIDFSFTKMKQLAHVAEEVAENGISPRLNMGAILTSSSIGAALQNVLESVQNSRKRHEQLKNDPEAQKHSGLLINLDLSIAQETYEADEIKDWLK